MLLMNGFSIKIASLLIIKYFFLYSFGMTVLLYKTVTLLYKYYIKYKKKAYCLKPMILFYENLICG